MPFGEITLKIGLVDQNLIVTVVEEDVIYDELGHTILSACENIKMVDFHLPDINWAHAHRERNRYYNQNMVVPSGLCGRSAPRVT